MKPAMKIETIWLWTKWRSRDTQFPTFFQQSVVIIDFIHIPNVHFLLIKFSVYFFLQVKIDIQWYAWNYLAAFASGNINNLILTFACLWQSHFLTFLLHRPLSSIHSLCALNVLSFCTLSICDQHFHYAPMEWYISAGIFSPPSLSFSRFFSILFVCVTKAFQPVVHADANFLCRSLDYGAELTMLYFAKDNNHPVWIKWKTLILYYQHYLCNSMLCRLLESRCNVIWLFISMFFFSFCCPSFFLIILLSRSFFDYQKEKSWDQC